MRAMAMNDLFGDPRVAVGKTDTSREAAEAVQGAALMLRARVLADIERCAAFGATASEVTAHIKAPLLNVRPRTTELRDMGLIVDSKRRRTNANGNREIVWVLADEEGAECAA